MSTNKPKVNKTCRILMAHTVLYVSYDIHKAVKHLCVRLEQNKLVAERGKDWELRDLLSHLAKEQPDQFTSSGRAWLGGRF